MFAHRLLERSMSVLPDLFGETDDTEQGNTFLHNILPLSSGILTNSCKTSLWSPSVTTRQPPQTDRRGYGLPEISQPAQFLCKKRDCLTSSIWREKVAVLGCLATKILSFPGQKGKKEECIIKWNKTQTRTSTPNYVSCMLSVICPWEKKRKDEEFFYIDANLDVENSNILQQQIENPVSGKACSDEWLLATVYARIKFLFLTIPTLQHELSLTQMKMKSKICISIWKIKAQNYVNSCTSIPNLTFQKTTPYLATWRQLWKPYQIRITLEHKRVF